MEWQGWFSLALTLIALFSMMFTRLAPHLVMFGVLTVLSLTGILSAQEALKGFGNEGLITVAAMFVIAAGLHATGGIDLLVNKLLGRPKTVRSALLRIFGPVVVMSGFLNNTPVVATLIPALTAWARKIDIPVSKLMIPLSYSAILGGTLTLIGTSTNLIVNGQYQTLTGNPGFSMFSIAAVGIPVALVGTLFMLIFFPRMLPNRDEKKPFANLREFTLEVAVAHNGPLVGKSINAAGLRHLKRIFLVEIERAGRILTAVDSEEKLQGGDRLVFAGNTEAISDLLRINGIVPSAENDHPVSIGQDVSERRLVEAVVSPHCGVVGERIRDAQFRDRYGAVVMAVARNGERVSGNLGSIRLEAGDTLLLEARPAFVTRQRYNKDFLLINDLDTETPRHDRAYLAWVILLGVVLGAGFELTSMFNAALLGVAAMIATGCCTMSQAEKSLDLPVLVTIGASFALGTALQTTGVASFIAGHVLELSGGRPWLLLVMTYVLVSLFTEVITNNAAAILTLPIVLEITEKAHLNQEPFVFAIMMAASASFATPLGYQCNLMVYGPGGYKFTDFLKVGIPMNLVIGVASVGVLLLGWPLS
jgi:di/tricarboxylate transporter